MNVPAEAFRAGVAAPDALAAKLDAAGVDLSHEAVLVTGAGVTKEAALAWAMLRRLGQRRVSVLVASFDSIDTMDRMARADFALTKEPTKLPPRVRAPASLKLLAASPPPPDGLVELASGATPTARRTSGKVMHLPAAQLLDADGTPKPAGDVWALLAKAGVPRYAEIVTVADDPADAALGSFVLQLMGFERATAQLD